MYLGYSESTAVFQSEMRVWCVSMCLSTCTNMWMCDACPRAYPHAQKCCDLLKKNSFLKMLQTTRKYYIFIWCYLFVLECLSLFFLLTEYIGSRSYIIVTYWQSRWTEPFRLFVWFFCRWCVWNGQYDMGGWLIDRPVVLLCMDRKCFVKIF